MKIVFSVGAVDGTCSRVINCAFDQTFYAKSKNVCLLLVYSLSPKVQKYLLGTPMPVYNFSVRATVRRTRG